MRRMVVGIEVASSSDGFIVERGNGQEVLQAACQTGYDAAA